MYGCLQSKIVTSSSYRWSLFWLWISTYAVLSPSRIPTEEEPKSICTKVTIVILYNDARFYWLMFLIYLLKYWNKMFLSIYYFYSYVLLDYLGSKFIQWHTKSKLRPLQMPGVEFHLLGLHDPQRLTSNSYKTENWQLNYFHQCDVIRNWLSCFFTVYFKLCQELLY